MLNKRPQNKKSFCNVCMQVETNKEKSLQRRVQSLQRFLLERLKSELTQRKPPPTLLAVPASKVDQPLASSPSSGAAEPDISASSAPAPTPGSVADGGSGDKSVSGAENSHEGKGLFHSFICILQDYRGPDLSKIL